MIKVAVTGANGKIGSKIIKTILKLDDMEVVAALGSPNSQYEEKDVGEVIGIGTIGIPIKSSQKLAEVLKKNESRCSH